MSLFPRRIPRAAAIVLLFLCFVVTARSQSMPGYQAPDKPKDQTPASVKAARGEAPLSKLYGHLKADAGKAKRLSPLKSTDLAKESKDEKLHRIGLVRELPNALNPLSDSALYLVKEGEVRVSTVGSEGARKLRVQFKDFFLPAGARVFVYSASDPNVYFGPYEGRGPWGDGVFWTPSMPGDQVVIEYTSPAGSTVTEPFKVSRVAHIYKETTAPDDPAASCNLEVADPWNNVKKSVAMLEFITGPFVADCTGTLLNDSNTSIDAYVLTAHHCISTQAEAQSTWAYWNYDSGETPPTGTASFGFDVAVTGSEGDFTLLHRAGAISGLFYSGWDASPVSAATSITGIHHPNGSHKRISFGTTNGNCSPFLPGPCASFTGVTWSQGITEPGSSGSGLWTGTGDTAKLVGTLTGGDSSCATPTESDYYSRFSVTYPNVAGFLNGSCVSNISPTTQSFPEGGGTGAITVNAPAGCAWTASSTESFVTITSGGSGTGPGTVNFSVAANVNGLQRTAYVVIGAQVFKVSQAAGGTCAPGPINFGQTVNGALATSDCHVEDHYVDSYSFNGTAGQHIAIELNSGAFDTYLFLARSDGTIIAENDDINYPTNTNSRIPVSGYLTLPATDTYTILATSFDPNSTGAYSLFLTEQPKQTLTVSSSNPNSGISVTVSQTDINGLRDGTTPFGRTYYQFSTITLIAPGSAGPNVVFLKWQKDGVDYSTSTSASVTMDTNHTMTAVYGATPTFVLTVSSSNPAGGVPVTVTPTDNSGFGSGSTQFSRTYNWFTQVSLTAPIDAGGTYFQKWQQDGNDLSNYRSINVNMSADHTVTAVYITLPPTPTPTPTPTPSGPGKAVAFQIDPAHTGFQFDQTVPPLSPRWSRDLGQPVSYPLIAGGKVFVTTIGGLYALDATNGATLWSTGDLGVYPVAAYDAGRVFVTTYNNGLVRAFDATSGALLWSKSLGGSGLASPPTAAAGTVYVVAPGAMVALSEQDGTTKWSRMFAGGDHSSPVVSADAIFGAYSCNNIWALAPSTGSVLWHHTSSCFGGGGRTAALFRGRIYARDEGSSNATLDAATGTQVGEFQALPAPAFNGATGYFLNISTLEARDVTTGNLKWSFAGDGTLSSAPIIVNGFVYIGSTSGKVYALNEGTGANVWTGTVGAAITRPDEHNLSQPVTGLGAGEGLIVVPASNLVVAYASSPRLLTDENNRVIALDSVTFVRDPFSIMGLHNFSSDQRTRVTIFTTNLGLNQPSGDLVVMANGFPLTVEAVGTLPGAPDISYIVVKLDPILTSDAQLTVIFHGMTTNSGILKITP